MISKEEVLNTIEKWQKAVDAGDIDGVVAFYHPEKGVLLGTMDTEKTGGRIGAERIKDYFKHFLGGRRRVEAHFPPEDKAQIEIMGSRGLYAGYYQFTLYENDGSVRKANAKFTYIMEKDGNNQPLIIHHNSGLTSKGIVGK